MTDTGTDTYRISINEKTGGNYNGTFKHINQAKNVETCRSWCISSINCKSWYFTGDNVCNNSEDKPTQFLSTPSQPNNYAGIVVNSNLPNATLITFWTCIVLFIIIVVGWMMVSKNGNVAMFSKIAYLSDDKFHAFQGLDIE